jgi:NADH:ubiquinone oxidoreductase subunit E
MGIDNGKEANMQKLIVEICVGTSCYLLGSQDLIETVENLPTEIRRNIELLGASCLKACGKGPNVRINGLILSNVTPEQLKEIICDNVLLSVREE